MISYDRDSNIVTTLIDTDGVTLQISSEFEDAETLEHDMSWVRVAELRDDLDECLATQAGMEYVTIALGEVEIGDTFHTFIDGEVLETAPALDPKLIRIHVSSGMTIEAPRDCMTIVQRSIL